MEPVDTTGSTYTWTYHPIVLVLDRDTFRLVATVRVDSGAPVCQGECYKGVIALSDEPALYVAWGWQPPATIAWRFSLPPDGSSLVP